MSQQYFLIIYGRNSVLKQSNLLIVKKHVNKDLLSKDPLKRMNINEVLEHPWIIKNSLFKLSEPRSINNETNYSKFKIYTTIDDKFSQ